MTNHKFTQKEVFTNAWSKIKHNAWFLFTVYFLAALALSSLSFSSMARFMLDIGLNVFVTGVLQIILKLVTYYFVCAALYNVTLKIVKEGSATYKDLLTPFKDYRLPTTYATASLIYTLFISIGFAAIITTLSTFAAGYMAGASFTAQSYLVIALATIILLVVTYFAMRFQFYKLAIIEDDSLSALAALKKSFDITRGHDVSLISFYALAIAFNVVGALAFGVGLLFTLPVSMFAYTTVYRRLTHHE